MGNRERKGVLMNQDNELDAFKREIDLRQFAVTIGYEMDRRESWRGSTVLRRGPDKIIVKRKGNGHYVFFSVKDDSDNGTLIDFLQRRQNLSLGAVRQILRPRIGRPVTPPQFPALEPSSPNRMRVESAYWRMANARRMPTWSTSAVCRRHCCYRRVCWLHADRLPPQHGISTFRRRGLVRIRDQELRIHRLCRWRAEGLVVLAYPAGR